MLSRAAALASLGELEPLVVSAFTAKKEDLRFAINA